MGWVSDSDRNATKSFEQNEVVTAPRSLLNKALVAQRWFDTSSCCPSRPTRRSSSWCRATTRRRCVAEDRFRGRPAIRITRWPSAVTVARTRPQNPFRILCRSNFRQFDVEGVRVYPRSHDRPAGAGRQFDYAGTTLRTSTGGFDYSGDRDPDGPGPLTGDGLSQCRPGVGVAGRLPGDVSDRSGPMSTVSTTTCRQRDSIPPGGRVQLADGNVFILKADTMVTGGRPRAPGCAAPRCQRRGAVRLHRPQRAQLLPVLLFGHRVRREFGGFRTVLARVRRGSPRR